MRLSAALEKGLGLSRQSEGSDKVPTYPDFHAALLTMAQHSLDAGMLQAIDEEALAHGPTHSAFMASAALEKSGVGLEPAALRCISLLSIFRL